LLLLSFSADPTYPQQIIYNQYTITPYLKNQLKTILGKKKYPDNEYFIYQGI
jgi:hypothetical protein